MNDDATSEIVTATDEFYSRNNGRSYTYASTNWPGEVTMSIEGHNGSSPLRVALLRIAGITVRHNAIDMRLLLRSALEMLDMVEQADQEIWPES